jgi:hypothetical protein
MSLKDALGFESFDVKNFFQNLKHDPKRAFLGVDPLSTKGWNAILGRNDKPLVNQFGGPTNDTFDKANQQGIDTGTASTLHGVAKGVAGALGAYGAGNGLINAGTSLASSTGGTAAVGAGTGALEGGGAAAGVGGAAGAAIPEVVVSGTTGGATGAGVAGGAAAGGATATESKGFDWQKLLKQGGGQMQQQGNDQQSHEDKLLEMLARQGPPPNLGGGVTPPPVDQYQESLTPPGQGIRAALG